MNTKTEIGTRSTTPHGLKTTTLAGISRAGVYVTERGDMLRVASPFMAAGQVPNVARDGLVTRLSEDPCEPVSECRRVASGAGLPFNF
jgi:hypothetical protein